MTTTIGHLWTQILDSHKMTDSVSSQSKSKTTHFRGKFVWIIVLFYFSKTNSTDPRQHVPLTGKFTPSQACF